mmetsp:Transcript_61863/g.182664  ORF Transcript_61863/g.182664 Transcript_61863/m.182664 type:complete len:88 (+) Transcript_61863:1415-1678(+)
MLRGIISKTHKAIHIKKEYIALTSSCEGSWAAYWPMLLLKIQCELLFEIELTIPQAVKFAVKVNKIKNIDATMTSPIQNFKSSYVKS